MATVRFTEADKHCCRPSWHERRPLNCPAGHDFSHQGHQQPLPASVLSFWSAFRTRRKLRCPPHTHTAALPLKNRRVPLPQETARWSSLNQSFIEFLHFFYRFVAEHVEHAFRAGVRRGVGDFDVGEVGRRSAESDVCCEYVDAFVDTFCADDGGAQNLTVRF